eukprot:m.42088 g.42088  ORF g.42088 m.42088 type:complete len:412 (+) comp8281_c0_seq1:173-1408(+)
MSRPSPLRQSRSSSPQRPSLWGNSGGDGECRAANGSFFANKATEGGSFFERRFQPSADVKRQQKWERKQWAPQWEPTTKWQQPATFPSQRPSFGMAADPTEIPAGDILPDEEAGFGCVGEGVYQIQLFLVWVKLLPEELAEEDGAGCFGPCTEEALATFQSKVKAIDRSCYGVYEAVTHKAMTLIHAHHCAKLEEAARVETHRQRLLAQQQAAVLAIPPRPVDTYTACAERIGVARTFSGSTLARRRNRFSEGGDEPEQGPACVRVDLRMPEGYQCCAQIDGVKTSWGDGFDEVPVFQSDEHTVADLVVAHRRYGRVAWPGKLQFTEEFELSEVVSLGPGEISIYQNTDTPPEGEAVNREAIVRLSNMKPSDSRSGEAFVAKLQEISEQCGSFISYVEEKAEWTFTIDNVQ